MTAFFVCTVCFWCCCLYHVVASSDYYLSGSLFYFDGAHQFCQTLCNSDIASIHSQQQQDAVVSALTVRDGGGWSNTPDAFIGLNSPDFPTFNYEWTDDTGFNFGSDVSGGVSPWALQSPSTEDCVAVQQTDIGSWYDVSCTNTPKRVVCADCTGHLNKFAVIPVSKTKDEAATACSAYYGTQLASIHSERDLAEALLLSSVVQPNHLWTGLSRPASSDTFQWDDDSPLHFLNTADISCTPWNDTISANASQSSQCAALTTDGCLDIVDCNQSHYILCNLPSELSTSLNLWNRWEGRWKFDSSDMTMRSVVNQSEYVMSTTQWFNGDEPLYIEYTFSTQFQANGKLSGLALYSRVGGSWCDWYYIAINRKQDGSYSVSLRRGDDNVRTLLASQPISVEYEENVPYTLFVEVTNGNEFVIGINDIEHISYIDNSSSWEQVTNGLSGYISLWDFDDVNTTAYSLYISGAPMQVTHISQMNSPIACNSAAPTANTKHPTEGPTKEPTVSPTTTAPTLDDEDNTFLSSTVFVISSTSMAPDRVVEDEANRDTVTIAIVSTVLVSGCVVLVVGLSVYYMRRRKVMRSKRAQTANGDDVQPGSAKVASMSPSERHSSDENDDDVQMMSLQPVKRGEDFPRQESEGIYEPVEGDGAITTMGHAAIANDVQPAGKTRLAPGFLISTAMTQK